MELQEFLNEVTGIRGLISTFRNDVLNISSLHNQSLQSYDHGSTAGSSGQLEALVADTSVLTKQIRDGIKYLERDTLMSDYSAQNTKGAQADKLKADFDKELKAYQQVKSSGFLSNPIFINTKINKYLSSDLGRKPVPDQIQRTNEPTIPHCKPLSHGQRNRKTC